MATPRCRRSALHVAVICAVFLGLIVPGMGAWGLPVFPGAVGFGTETPAGRGGTIYKVTNLNDSGPGSFRAGAESPGKRIIVFEVSGTITLNKKIVIRNPYITIAGQTAPSPGITIRGQSVEIATHDVLIQHIRFRTGSTKEGQDGLTLFDVQNVVLDHNSISWASDENVGLWYNGSTSGNHSITFSNNIISEALHGWSHSMGLLLGRHFKKVAVLRNLFAHVHARPPEIQGDTTSVVANNMIYNTMYIGIYVYEGHGAGPMQTSIMGNVVEPGPSTRPGLTTAVRIHSSVPAGSKIYVKDNGCDDISSDPWTSVDNRTNASIRASSPPVTVPGLALLKSSEVENWVLSNAGARPADRDAVDNRVVDTVRRRGGKIINSYTDVGGWPSLAQNRRPFPIPADPHGDSDGNGYTNIEEVLHRMAREVETGFSSPGDSFLTAPGNLHIQH